MSVKRGSRPIELDGGTWWAVEEPGNDVVALFSCEKDARDWAADDSNCFTGPCTIYEVEID
jgi:hypothetical protein